MEKKIFAISAIGGLTKFVSFGSYISSNMSRNLSDVSEWRVYETPVKVLLAHLCSQSFRCSKEACTTKDVLVISRKDFLDR